jgi:hypothetical protein
MTEPRRSGERPLFDRIGDIGTAAQATIPGLYAWAVTVAPAAWGRGAPLIAKIVAILGVGCLAAAIVVERRTPRWARPTSVWGLVLTSLLVWLLVPAAMLPNHLDAPRGVAGMIGWALFAFASAAPALPRDAESARVVAGQPLRPRTPIPRGDAWFILGGTACALALQAIGWRVAVPERALLVRIVALAAGLAIVGAATQIAMARHGKRHRPSRKTRVRRSVVALTALGVLAVAGVLLLLLGR